MIWIVLVQRKHRRTPELIFRKPVSGNVEQGNVKVDADMAFVKTIRASFGHPEKLNNLNKIVKE